MRDSVQGGALTEVTFYILLALTKPRHGYAVMQFISERTGGRLRPGAGTLYGALSALEKRGWIVRCGAGGRRQEYELTPDGLAAAQAELARLRALADAAEEILWEADCNGKTQILRPNAEGAGQMAEQNGVPGLASG